MTHAHLQLTDSGISIEIYEHVNAVISALPMYNDMWTSITTELSKDPGLQLLQQNVEEGWQRNCKPKMLALRHEEHLGTEKCKCRAHAVLYWLTMKKDIEEIKKQATVHHVQNTDISKLRNP